MKSCTTILSDNNNTSQSDSVVQKQNGAPNAKTSAISDDKDMKPRATICQETRAFYAQCTSWLFGRVVEMEQTDRKGAK